MGARRRSRDRRSRKPAAGLVLVFAALLLGLSYLPGATGVPVLLASWQRRLLGVAAPAVPAYVFLTGVVLVAAGERARFTRRVLAILLGSTSALMAVHASLAAGDLLAAGRSGAGAGLVGGVLTWGAAELLGVQGLWVATGALGVVSLGLLAGVTAAAIGAWLRAGARAAIVAALVLVRLVRAALVLVGSALRRTWGVVVLGASGAARAVLWVTAGLLTAVLAGARRLAVRLLVHPIHRRAPRSAPEPAVHPDGPGSAAQRLPADGVPVHDAASARQGHPGFAEAQGAAAQPTAPELLLDKAAPASLPGAADRRRTRRSAQRPWAEDAQERLDFASVDYRLPPLSVLGDAATSRGKARIDPADTARALEQTLESFGVKARVIHWEVGPVVTRFEVQPDPGVKVQKITSLTNDIALNLAAQSVRIEAPIPGKSAVGIELPNQKASLVHLREILTADVFQKAASPLVVAVGKDIAGHPIVADLAEMPHLLIAGATGSGKSVALNAMIASLLFRSTPQQVRLVMIDPKRVELTDYNDIPHLLTPVVTNPRQAASVLKDMLRVMDQRFELFAAAGARNIQSYNQMAEVEPLYYVVIIVDELADLMMVAPADFEDIICRLAQMTRATGIHMVVATQRPSVDVITGLIKANIPSRLAFAVSSQVDSRTILDGPGAEKLLGRGDMLFLPLGASRAIRAQGAYIADDEIRAVVEWWRQQGRPVYDQQLVEAQQVTATEEGADGERLIEAARLVVRSGYGSVSLLQRKMRVGYVTAARLIDELEARGVVGPVQGSSPREVLVGLNELERMLRSKSLTRKG